MTIFEICSIVLNMIIGALVIGYGIWLRRFFKHQIRAKDVTIEALESALTTNDAEISRLHTDTAIAEAYARMRPQPSLKKPASESVSLTLT